MKDTIGTNNNSINEIIRYLNYCHDACIKKVEFFKEREVDKEDGSIIYPFINIEDIIKCDIKIELIHNNYENSKIDQIIIIEFKEVKAFNFMQNDNFDYSIIYELSFTEKNGFNFSFLATKEKIKVLDLICNKIILHEC